MEELRTASPLRVGDVMLVPIERVGIRSDLGDGGYWISAFKEAFAVILCDASGIRALAMDSSEIPLDDLITETPDLGAILAEISAS